MTNQRIVCAANKHINGSIILGARHFDKLMHEAIKTRLLNNPSEVWYDSEQGFIDQQGNFLSRKEAWVIAVKQNQIVRLVGNQKEESRLSTDIELFSENLY